MFYKMFLIACAISISLSFAAFLSLFKIDNFFIQSVRELFGKDVTIATYYMFFIFLIIFIYFVESFFEFIVDIVRLFRYSRKNKTTNKQGGVEELKKE